MKNKVLFAVFFILTVYSGVTTYAIYSEFDLKSYVLSYTGSESSDYKANPEAEYGFVRQVLEDYFVIEKGVNQKEKYDSIASIVADGIKSDFLVEFKNAIDIYAEQNAVRNYDLKKIFRDKKESLSYVVFLNMKNEFPKEKEGFLMKIKLSLKPDSLSKSYRIKSWTEKILPLPSKLLSLKDVYVDQSSFTELKLPCDFQHVGPVKGHKNVAVSLESRGRLIKFKPQDKLIDHANYKASCKKQVFTLNLISDENLHTVYQAFNYSYGVSKIRKLTEREKRIRLLEKHMGVKVVR